ncbi:MAG: hypothetical protein KGI80_05295 [Verrucomicrobiota bacterium]|nr:hypothetical protein [Verrucomicrobiota bacterium]
MSNRFTIALDLLLEGKKEKIQESVDSSLLEIEEGELSFPSPILVEGEIYIADEELIFHMQAKTVVRMPCAICNELWEFPLYVAPLYHTQALSELKEMRFDWREPLREALLLEVPHYVECREGQCPQRPLLAPYLKDKGQDGEHFPFSALPQK